MRTWDYDGFAVGPVLTLLEEISDQKIMIVFGKNGLFLGRKCALEGPILAL